MIAIPAVDQVLNALDALTDTNPDLEPAIDFYEELLPVLYEARPDLTGLALNRELAQTKLKEGVPLLWGEFGGADTLGAEPNIDLFMTLCRLAAEGGNDSGEALMRAMLEGKLDLQVVINHALVLDRAALAELARKMQADLTLLEEIARLTLTPITRAYAMAFSQAMDFAGWGKGYCPVCGAWPVLGELQGRDKIRRLRCGRCGTGWKFNRLECLWCNNKNRKELGFLFDPDEPAWRVDICDYCQGYLKTKITFDPLEAEMLLVHDLESLFLDQIATNKGYKRPYIQPLK